MFKILLILMGIVPVGFCSSLNLDMGKTETIFNRISIPKSQEDQLSLAQGDQITSYRLTGFIDLASNNQFYFLYAPLQVQYQFVSDKNFRFNETDFATATATTFNYKFNSYRIGYLWTWKISSLRYWGGVVGKIRDAETEVIQGNQRDIFTNVGFVPLLGFGFEFQVTPGLSLFHHTDALGSTQGSAYDSNLEIKYRFGSLGLSIGKRVLGGGADNETVYNFSQFDTTYLRVSIN